MKGDDDMQKGASQDKDGKEKDFIYKKERKCCICMVSDFFYPNLGGIETHIFELSKQLIRKGFKVIVVTHCYNNRHGVRWMGNGIKVYYLPFETYMDVVTFPNVIGTLPLCRNILYREKVDIVHGHQATSALAHQFILHAKSLGIKTIYTDHSLYSFSDKGCIHVNKLLKYCMNDVDHSICVSHTNRENLVLRTEINPYKTSVIGNALDTKKFIPCISKRPKYPRINIIVISRLTYRKGVDLIVKVIPLVCQKYPFIKFIIGGDGPKRVLLEEMRERYRLHNCVVLLGKVKQENVKNVLQSGHIFLNTSLTEAFCIAIIEAASCGLLVISTDVGGISEVLPYDMMILAKPNHVDLCKAVDYALDVVQHVDSNSFHERLTKMYSWEKVAEKTEKVYMDVLSYTNPTILNRIRKIYDINTVFSKVYIFIIMLSYIYCQLLEWIKPRKDIEEVVSFPHFIEDD
ncbi:phosphatidylinositol N-acetylglucosaminyltransferase subunit A, putative [Plasmodium ovale wallikeri]|uniref:phosphatidylinositol N-acetylglucosaminyltransferase n=2 Tax=Plasmodium ovale TaxID=36330 RepID=A0A1A8YN39_PLAOA|nr:phosphatidylinositol N-acetylglucosaminyltransferase subunit A, putative [Plasmodium ovale wallikeri]SBT33415.1 phosphatidylinositol N-acetylglucosaminyltransferase subunit A, putative [Plasmodium ovale wallikeri]SBT76155.1 phosphatidylinositol N-acetylglucosaminyltransferase subunit A, putative [Plasmodium ovale]